MTSGVPPAIRRRTDPRRPKPAASVYGGPIAELRAWAATVLLDLALRTYPDAVMEIVRDLAAIDEEHR